MIEFHCSPANPHYFIVWNVSTNPGCSLIVSIAYIVIGVTVLLLIFLLVTTVTDGLDWVLRTAMREINRRFVDVRVAKLFFVAVPVETEGKTEILIAVRNEEFWLQADEIAVNSKFIDSRNWKIDNDIRWAESVSQNNTISIPRKRHKSLHFATIDIDKLIIHFVDGDEAFPFPNTENSYYVHPLIMSGSMTFLGYKVKRVFPEIRNEVLVYNNKQVKIRYE